MKYFIQPSTLSGAITIPPSKSHTLRAILFASLADGESVIENILLSPDTNAMMNACRLFGAEIIQHQQKLLIKGVAGKPQTPNNIIDAGNSGQVLRFVAAIAALLPDYTVLTGDLSLRSNRPIQDLLQALQQLNVTAISTRQNGFAPIIIKGPMHGTVTMLDGQDSQPVSALLMASAFAKQAITINVLYPGETPWIDVTLDWFKRLGISYQQNNYRQYQLFGNANYKGFNYTVPGDFSSAAFPLVAALITRSRIILNNLDMKDSQGDKTIVYFLQQIGAKIEIDEVNKKLYVMSTANYTGTRIDVNKFIDALPILAVMACFANSETYLYGAAIARQKESNRLATITQELKKMGAKIIEHDDGLIVQPSNLKAAQVESHHDHRIAMALAIAGLAANGETVLKNPRCISKSYPYFLEHMQQLGASIQVKNA